MRINLVNVKNNCVGSESLEFIVEKGQCVSVLYFLRVIDEIFDLFHYQALIKFKSISYSIYMKIDVHFFRPVLSKVVSLWWASEVLQELVQGRYRLDLEIEFSL